MPAINNMKKSHFKAPRSLKSWKNANIIIFNGLFDEFHAWCLMHPSIKSKYRASTLFLKHKGLLYDTICFEVFKPCSCNMDTLYEFFRG